jgi:DNA-binding NarL/FixJ family response regulator
MRYVSSIEEITREDTQREIALNLFRKGMSVEDIASVTQLSIEKIRELQPRQK